MGGSGRSRGTGSAATRDVEAAARKSRQPQVPIRIGKAEVLASLEQLDLRIDWLRVAVSKTAARRRRLVTRLAASVGPSAAAELVGVSRQSVWRATRRPVATNPSEPMVSVEDDTWRLMCAVGSRLAGGLVAAARFEVPGVDAVWWGDADADAEQLEEAIAVLTRRLADLADVMHRAGVERAIRSFQLAEVDNRANRPLLGRIVRAARLRPEEPPLDGLLRRADPEATAVAARWLVRNAARAEPVDEAIRTAVEVIAAWSHDRIGFDQPL